MGLEFEYNAREIQRLVITNASKHPLALGIRPRDILIGIGDQIVPRATNPLAVHQHLVACVRPVILHFYRPHERQKEVNARSVESLRCDSLVRGQKNVLTVGASALWGRFLAPTQTNKSSFASVPRALLSTTKLVSGFVQRRLPSEFAIPAVRMNSVRYGTDDDGTPINAEKRCILNEGTRLALIRALKPLLRPKPWELVYDSACDGMCLGALYAHAGAAKSSQAQLILCRDNLGHIGGAFLDEPIRNVLDCAPRASPPSKLPLHRLAIILARASALSSLLLEGAGQEYPRRGFRAIQTFLFTAGPVLLALSQARSPYRLGCHLSLMLLTICLSMQPMKSLDLARVVVALLSDSTKPSSKYSFVRAWNSNLTRSQTQVWRFATLRHLQ